MSVSTINIVGAGAFGTALAHVWQVAWPAAPRHRVRLWCRDAAQVQALSTSGLNIRVPDAPPLATFEARHWDDFEASDPGEILILAVKARAQAHVFARLSSRLHPDCPVITVSKGFADDDARLLGEAVQPRAGLAVLSGPSFAADLFNNRPTALTLAHSQPLNAVAEALSTPRLRLYQSDDPVGVQVCGALKNVIAIACGCADGMGLGASARSALMTRGLREIERVIVAYGGDVRTAAGLAGIGDLALTCQDRQSRNHSFGYQLGQGAAAGALLDQGVTVEGALAAQSVLGSARTRDLDLPICEAVGQLVRGDLTPEALASRLLARGLERPPATDVG